MTVAATPLCSRCRGEPAKPGQRWGKQCHAAYMQQWRRGHTGLGALARRFARAGFVSRVSCETDAREAA